MKILDYPARPGAQSSGSAMMVMLAMLAIVGLLVVANTRTVNWVRAEVRLIDQRESARMGTSVTNQALASTAQTKPATTP